MGYTHYFQQKTAFTNKSWDLISEDIKKLMTLMDAKGIHLETNDNKSDEMINSERVNFNGQGNSSYETFQITKKLSGGFNFCKTAHYPYDFAVMCTLLLMNYHQENALDISSDGGLSDWTDAMLFNANHFGYAYKLPKNIEKVENKDDVKQVVLEAEKVLDVE